jgi:hypothetical protein
MRPDRVLGWSVITKSLINLNSDFKFWESFSSSGTRGNNLREKLARRIDQLTAESAATLPPTQSSHKETSFRSVELLQG